jgi:Gas vesicle synthesis protein GvpL/GvpF
MSTHLYCVLPQAQRGAIPPGLSGVNGGRVRALPFDGLVAWVSDVERTVPVSIDGVRAHDAVVEAALDTGSTPVPARFGQRFDSDDACRAALERRAVSVETLLSSMQGFVEMTLLLTPSMRRVVRDLEPVMPQMVEEPGPGIGRRYLDSLRAREASNDAVRRSLDILTNRLTGAAGQFVKASAVEENLARMPFRRLSHLVSRGAIVPYKEAIDAVKPTTETRFLLIGPRAPYSFCALGADGGAHGMKLAD